MPLFTSHMKSLLLRGGRVVNCDEEFIADVLIEDGVITRIGDLHSVTATEVIDCTGKYVIPGGIDPHTHIQMQGAVFRVCDDWFTGTRAAAAGGTTCVLDFVPINRGDKPKECLLDWEEQAKRSVIDYSFHMSVVDWNDEFREAVELAIAHGINSAKLYLAYKDNLMLKSESDFIDFFGYAAAHGILPQVHCEDGDLIPYLQDKLFSAGHTTPAAHPLSRPNYVEEKGVKTAIAMANATDCPVYIVHNTCREAIDAVERGSSNRQPVIGECTITHLVYNDSLNSNPDFDIAAGAALSPPLRSEADRLALWDALRRGTIKTICTDHCPWTLAQKRTGISDFRKIPNGVPAIEERMVLAWSYGVDKGLISPMEYVAATSTNAAKIFGLFPRKGAIRTGSDADIVVIDPKAKRVITKDAQKCACDYNLFEGIEVTGVPVLTVSAGRIVWRCEVVDGVAQYKEGFITEESSGRFIPRKTFVPAVFRLNQ